MTSSYSKALIRGMDANNRAAISDLQSAHDEEVNIFFVCLIGDEARSSVGERGSLLFFYLWCYVSTICRMSRMVE
jgi:hypothetical protein